MSERQREAVAIATLVALKAVAMAYALHCGFAQVSDDDYARTVIAQMFVHSPKLDPSGTSWLPLPFWVYGTLMMVVGRSLTVARTIAFVLGVASPIVVYGGLRSMRIACAGACVGASVGTLTPWSIWLGLAPVPEGWAGSCAAAALFFLASGRARWAGTLALVAALSRYEAWPVAGLVVVTCLARHDRPSLEAAALATAGPVAWLVNNLYAHHDALHFVTRVTSFHHANVAAATLAQRILEYPVALLRAAPDVLVAAVVGAIPLLRHRSERTQWALPIGGMLMVLVFLICGNVREGAPTHHAIRALVPVIVVLGALGGVGIASLHRHTVQVVAVIAWFGLVMWRMRDVPGSSETEQRDAQIAHGRALAVSATSLDVTPCAYEHFALVAAFGAPERVSVATPTHEPITRDCPRVSVRSRMAREEMGP